MFNPVPMKGHPRMAVSISAPLGAGGHMLFDISKFRAPLPNDVQVFASGANRLSEIRGFAKLGIAIGVAVNHLNESAIAELITLQQLVMIDSGAFSEVVAGTSDVHVTSLITDQEWRRRLAIYLRLATSLREKAILVAPDQVGNQEETLLRLERYRAELTLIAATSATLLLPLQIGSMSHIEFLTAAERAAGIPLVPAMPMRKAATSIFALTEFVREVKPRHVHLLGMGIENHRADKILRLIRHFSPRTSISLDSNRIRAVTGVGRPMTMTEIALRSTDAEDIYAEVDSPVLALTGDRFDYTDSIAFPSGWCTAEQLYSMAVSVGMLAGESAKFRRDPDSFLQGPFRDNAEISWMEYPLMELELNRAWEAYLDQTIRSAVRTAAIVSVFQESSIRRRCA
jgi:hypothetical protein